MTGTTLTDIPGYTLLRPIGRGGMASVFLALQQSLGREVALKLLVAQQDADGSAAERFLREARIAASLHHPNIVPIHDFGVHEGTAYIAMAYETGGTIAPLPGEKLAPRDALRLVRDVAAALDYAHARGVVHRDIKPENILRREDGGAMLSDFGIARLIEGGSVLTTEGTSVGTPHYMSPEQLRGDKVDGRSDLYSLGVVLWQLLTGELPYVGTDGWAIGTQHLNADIPRLPAALAHLQPLVDSLLAKKAEARLQSGGELVQRIDALLSGQVTPNTAPTVAVQAARRRREDSEPAPLNPAPVPPGRVLGFVAVALLVPIAFFGWRQFVRTPHPPAARTATSVAAVRAPAPVAAVSATSIAVLPLEDLSVAHDQGYFSDGMAEELQSRLAQVPGLSVAGRTSSQSFKGKGATIAQVGKALDVGNVLEGSVRKDGARLRVTMRLSNVATGFQTWTQTYDRKLTDVFAVQDDIAGAVVDTLKLKLLTPQGTGGVGKHVPRFEVYDEFLRGRQAMMRDTAADFEQARASYRKTVALDPDYADAWSGLAMAESFVDGESDDPVVSARGYAAGLAAAERALQLDPQLGDAYAARGYIRTCAWDWDDALADITKAVQLDPRDGRNQLRHGFLLAILGRLPEAQAALEEGTRADPLLTPLWFWLGRVHAAQGNYAAARQVLNRALAIDPKFTAATGYLATISLLEGDAARARTQFLALDRKIGVAMADYRLGHVAEARRELADALAATPAPDVYVQAIGYAGTGQHDRALDLLEQMVARHDANALAIPYDAQLRDLRGDSRFAALLAKMGLPPH
jgi:TolB-like protein/tetratricopeptide (TPR) repeat protein